MNKYVSILLAFCCLLILITACKSSETKEYRGRVLEIDFNNVEKIEPGNWIKIDKWKFTHVRSMQDGAETDLALPSDYIVIDTMETRGRAYGTSMNPMSIGVHIVGNLQQINTTRLTADEPRYTVPNPGLLAAASILKIAKTDSSYITITVPKDYPIPIRVAEK